MDEEIEMIAILAGSVLLLITCLALLLRKIALPRVTLSLTATWIDELSSERYRPAAPAGREGFGFPELTAELRAARGDARPQATLPDLSSLSARPE